VLDKRKQHREVTNTEKTPAITAVVYRQIVIQQWEENWRHFNVRLWNTWLNLSDGNADKSMQIVLIKVSTYFASNFLEKAKVMRHYEVRKFILLCKGNTQQLLHSRVASPKMWGGQKNLEGANLFDFRRNTLFYLRYCLSVSSKTFGRVMVPGLRLCSCNWSSTLSNTRVK